MKECHDSNPNPIAPHVIKQEVRSAEVEALPAIFEKSGTEPKPNLHNIVNNVTFYVRTLNTINQLSKLTASAVKHNRDIICVRENRYYHSELELKYHGTDNTPAFVSLSAWKVSVNAAIGDVGMLLNSRALKSLNIIEKNQPKMMGATFNSNSCTTIVSYYSPTKISDETGITNFYNVLSSFARHIPEHNVQIDKDENSDVCLHNLLNKNGDYLADFSLQNSLSFLNTKFQEGRENYGPSPTQITLKHI